MLRAAGAGVLLGLEDDDRRALAHDEAVAVDVVGARGVRGVVVALRERLHRRRTPATVSGWIAASVPPATTTSARPAAGLLERVADRLGARGAGRDRGAGAGAGAELSETAAAAAFGMSIGHGHGQDAPRALLAEGVPRVQQGPDAADAGAR